MDAVKTYECSSFTHYRVGKYRVTTYPDSYLIYIVLSEKTHKRIVGKHVEKACREAVEKAA